MRALLFPMTGLLMGLALTALADTSETPVAAITRLGGTFDRGPGGASAHMVKVDLHGSAVTDSDLAFLSSLTSLEILDLRLTKVGDAALEQVKGLTHLKFLNLFRTGVTDAGLAKLSQLKDLETLLLGGTAVTDEGLANLKAFPRLRKVSLFDTKVSDAGLARLESLDHLEIVGVSKSKVTEEGMKRLKKANPRVGFEENAAPARSDIVAALFKIVGGEGFIPPAKNEPLQALLAKKPSLTFYEACGVGDSALVARKLKEDPKLATSWNDFGWSALHLAAFSGSPETVTLLLDAGADVNARAKTKFRNTPLQAALLTGQFETAKLLLEHGADANVRQSLGFTPFQEAAFEGRRDLIDILLSHGAELNSRADDGRTALTEALRGKHPEIADYLKSKGAKGAEITADVTKSPE